jgi:hypothetical protein
MPIDGFRDRGFYVIEYHNTNISAHDLTLRKCQQIEPSTFSAVLRPRKESAKMVIWTAFEAFPYLLIFVTPSGSFHLARKASR